MPRAHPDTSLVERLAWGSWHEAAWLIMTGGTRRPALRVALVVGTLLSAVNQTGVVLHAECSAASALRIAANYAIPYVVSSVGFLSAHRHSARRGA